MIRLRFALAAGLFLGSLCAISQLHAAPPPDEKPDVKAASATADGSARVDLTVALSVLPGQMKFDISRFTVRPGSLVRVTLNNPDAMPHNWVLCRGKAGEAEIALAQKAWAMPNAIEKGYVPESDLVLASSKMLSPQQTDAVTFRAPKEVGEYPYVCTYPGHALIMRGVMRVSETDPVGAGPPAGLRKLNYAYFEDAWKALPKFDDLKPKAEKEIEANAITLKPRGRDEDFGIVYDGEFVVREAGRYRFFVGGRGGWRLTVNDKVVSYVASQARVSQLKDGVIELKAGAYPFLLEYFHTAGPPELGVACKLEVSGSNVFSLSESDISDRVGSLMLKVANEPLVMRLHLPDASPRSIAVGMPGGINYCFDATGCFVRYGWEGDFLDVGPERGNGTGRGGVVCKVDNVFQVGGAKSQPLQIGTAKPTSSGAPSAAANVQFLGYHRNGADAPSFNYRMDGVTVTQTVAPAASGRGLKYTYRLDPPSEASFTLNRKGLSVSNSAGEWTGDVLKIPAGQSREFSITIDAMPNPHAHADAAQNGEKHHVH